MANIKSAKKRIKVNKRQKSENKFKKATVNTSIKKFKKLVDENNFVEADKRLVETISLIDSACSHGVYHKNNASRKVARLSSYIHNAKNKAGVVEAPVKKEAKPAAKKEVKVEAAPVVEEVVVAKKAPAKKAATAKTASAKTTAPKAEKAETVKKPAAKKAPVAKAEGAEKKAPAKKTVAKKAE